MVRVQAALEKFKFLSQSMHCSVADSFCVAGLCNTQDEQM